MKLQLNQQGNQALNLGSNTAPIGEVNQSWKAKLAGILQRVAAYLITASEPTVWTVQDATGLIHWKGYDPTTNRSIDCASEQEMRIWIERRYHL